MAEFVASIDERPRLGAVFLLLFPVPIVCFLGALATDFAYSQSELLMWLHFSQWMIATGLAVGGLAILALIVNVISHRRGRPPAMGWLHVALFFLMLAVELVNAFEHTADGWTAVVPNGMILSAVGALLGLIVVGSVFAISRRYTAMRSVR